MRYYLDTEFNGFGGDLISLALVRDDGASLYLLYRTPAAVEPWVAEHVMPLVSAVPSGIMMTLVPEPRMAAEALAKFLHGDPAPTIIADWPDDIAYLCKALITGPGMMIRTPDLTFEVRRVDAYPNDGSPQLPGAVQHNAWWDAMALRYVLRPDLQAAAA